jgi:hypothetical protein
VEIFLNPTASSWPQFRREQLRLLDSFPNSNKDDIDHAVRDLQESVDENNGYASNDYSFDGANSPTPSEFFGDAEVELAALKQQPSDALSKNQDLAPMRGDAKNARLGLIFDAQSLLFVKINDWGDNPAGSKNGWFGEDDTLTWTLTLGYWGSTEDEII